MLRIREYNKITGKKIELEELEKFGFEENENNYFYYGFTRPNSNSEISILIDIETRDILTYFDINVDNSKIHDKIYDLITAGYVEKVEEE